MKPSDVATLLGLGRSTVTAWTNDEWREYFSPSAQGGQGRPRNFTDIDVKLMYALKTLKENNTPPESIHETFRRWRANDWQDLPDMPAAPANFASVAVVPVAAADAALSTERRALLREIATLQQMTEDLKAELAHERTGRREDVERLMREIADAQAAQREAEIMVKLYEQGRLKPKE